MLPLAAGAAAVVVTLLGIAVGGRGGGTGGDVETDTGTVMPVADVRARVTALRGQLRALRKSPRGQRLLTLAPILADGFANLDADATALLAMPDSALVARPVVVRKYLSDVDHFVVVLDTVEHPNPPPKAGANDTSSDDERRKRRFWETPFGKALKAIGEAILGLVGVATGAGVDAATGAIKGAIDDAGTNRNGGGGDSWSTKRDNFSRNLGD